jgi:hypothetical protein
VAFRARIRCYAFLSPALAVPLCTVHMELFCTRIVVVYVKPLPGCLIVGAGIERSQPKSSRHDTRRMHTSVDAGSSCAIPGCRRPPLLLTAACPHLQHCDCGSENSSQYSGIASLTHGVTLPECEWPICTGSANPAYVFPSLQALRSYAVHGRNSMITSGTTVTLRRLVFI